MSLPAMNLNFRMGEKHEEGKQLTAMYDQLNPLAALNKSGLCWLCDETRIGGWERCRYHGVKDGIVKVELSSRGKLSLDRF